MRPWTLFVVFNREWDASGRTPTPLLGSPLPSPLSVLLHPFPCRVTFPGAPWLFQADRPPARAMVPLGFFR